MEFTFETVYDQKTLTAMARGLRKTVRKKRSRRSLVFGVLVVILGSLLTITDTAITIRQVITWLAIAVIVMAFIWQDHINGYFAGKRVMPGLDKSTATFHERGYHSVTAVGESDFPYSNIQMIAEDRDYFIFIFSANHAQVYDKRTLSGGTAEEFAKFIAEKTEKQIKVI